MKFARAICLLLSFAATASMCLLQAEKDCQPPRIQSSALGPNIFSQQQEVDLGDVLAQRLPRYVRVTDDPAVTAYLQHIGERLASHLPPTQFRFRYFLVDFAIPDAFSSPGGRIYVSRKMVSFVHSEDEMAGIIAHEMGHIVTHQGAIDMTALLHDVLGITQVSDRQDILKKYDDLEENWRRNPVAFRRVAKRGLEKQLIADQVALHAVTTAGYSAQSYVDAFDRLTQTRGKTGNWLSDFFRTTKPSEARLREMLKSVENLPRACVQPPSATASSAFEKWRTAVYDFSEWNRRSENLHGVLAKVKLDPLVPRNIQHLRFSPDGKYILAQVVHQIYILTRKPFSYLFAINAPDAWQPQFTPDSGSVAFTSGELRAEVWDIASQKRALVYEPVVQKGCSTTLLAPDANTLACFRRGEPLSLIDLPTGTRIFEKEPFPGDAVVPRLGFSPDGRYFLAANSQNVVAVDVGTRKNLMLPKPVKDRLSDGFVFLGPDRLLVSLGLNGVRGSAPQKLPSGQTVFMDSYRVEHRPATLFAFPSGEVIDQLPVGWMTTLAPPAHGDYVLLGPLKDYAVGVMDLKTKKIFLANKERAFDIYDQVFVRQIPDGDFGLYDVKTRALQARVRLPLAPDSSRFLRAFASPGLKWLAATEGPIWDLSTGKKLYFLRDFTDGWFDCDEAFYADFPKSQETPRTIARVDLTRQDITLGLKVEEPHARQNGPFLVVSKPQKRGGIVSESHDDLAGAFGALARALTPCRRGFPDYGPLDCDVTQEVRDVRTGQLLWSRRFPKENPGLFIEPEEGRALIKWPVSAAAVQEELKNYPELAEQLAAEKEKKGVYFVEVLDASNGKPLRALFVDTGGQGSISTVGNRIIVSHQGYMEIYSLATGQKQGEILGWPREHSKTAGLITVRSDNDNELAIYDLNSREKLDEFAFPSKVDMDQFSQDGKRLFVLTGDQTAYFLDVSGTGPSSVVTGEKR